MAVSCPRIQFRSVSKSFGATRALDGVTFDVLPGTVHALVGENGAGKSTLMRILAGVARADDGDIELDGKRADLHDARAAQAAGVAMVHQEFSLIPDLNVAENVYLGRWPKHPGSGWIRRHQLEQQTARLLSDLELDLPIRARAASLSVAQQQLVEIAKALSLNARVLVLDEPSAVLTPHELASLFRLVRQLTARGVSVLYISHRMDEIFELASWVTVLRDGRHISTHSIAQVNRRQLIADCVGRTLEAEFPSRVASVGPSALRIKELSSTGRFSGVSFDIRAGEVLGLTGLVGSGRSSVAKSIFGAAPVASGQCFVHGAPYQPANPIHAKRIGIAYVPEDRRREGLLMARPLRENLTLAELRDAQRCGWLSIGRERRMADRLIQSLRLKTSGMEARVSSLSGGNQQKCLLGRWFLKPYSVMLLDEPTRGVDVGAKAEIYSLINDLALRGAAVLMISSELPEVIGMSDRIAVMCRGRLAGILDNSRRQVMQEEIMRLAIGEAAA